MKSKNINLRNYRIKTSGRVNWQSYKCLATNENEFIKKFLFNCIFMKSSEACKDEVSIRFVKYLNTEIEQYLVTYKKVTLTALLIKNIKYY